MVSTIHGRGLFLFYEFVGWLTCWSFLVFLGFCFYPLLPWMRPSLYTAGVLRERPLFWRVLI